MRVAGTTDAGEAGRMDEPGALLASGRDGDIFELGDDGTRVLRRTRDGRSLAGEARILEHVHAAGLPVPRVHELRAGDTELVMDRIHGPTMVQAFSRRPWTLRSHAHVLAEMHRLVHAVDAPPWLPQLADGGDRLVHLDIHPLNVLYGPDGPVLIDWTNASRGRPETDLAHTWLIIASADTSDAGGWLARVADPVKRRLVRRVLEEFDRDAIVPFLRPVADERALDRNIRPAELEEMRRIVEREERRIAERA
jgi:aminoglycoside phosphotransferase (APT) family kinase protein